MASDSHNRFRRKLTEDFRKSPTSETLSELRRRLWKRARKFPDEIADLSELDDLLEGFREALSISSAKITGEIIASSLGGSPSLIISGNQGDVTVNQGNRSIDASNGGIVNQPVQSDNSIVTFQNVQAYNNTVDSAKNIPASAKSLLKSAREAIEREVTDTDERSAVLTQLEKLTNELDNPSPKKGVLSTTWGAISWLAEKLKPIAELGVVMFKLHGVGTPTSP